jgi:serine/threonine protein kinase
MTSLKGQVLGHYNILEQVGEGGLSTVYKAFDTYLKCDVAIKIIRTDQFSPRDLALVLKRFKRTIRSIARLSHPNIVTVIDYGKYQNAPYLVYEYLSGGTLKERLGEKFTYPDAVCKLMAVADALAYAHQLGVIHGNIKPSNILFTETNTPMLSDFGIAEILETHPGASLADSGIGNIMPEYIAPEQGLGQPIDARTDVYSMGIVLYEMLTGRKPFQADTPLAVVSKQISEPLPPPRQFSPDLPEQAENFLFKALAKEPANRYQDITSFFIQLVRLVIKETGGTANVFRPKPVESPADVTLDKPLAESQPVALQLPSEEKIGRRQIQINRLETVVMSALAAENFEDAENSLSKLEGLGKRGNQAASRLRLNLEQTRQKVHEKDEEISRLKAAIPVALEAEDIPLAEELLHQLQLLGPEGRELANQFQIEIATAREAPGKTGQLEQARQDETRSQPEKEFLSNTSPPLVQRPVPMYASAVPAWRWIAAGLALLFLLFIIGGGSVFALSEQKSTATAVPRTESSQARQQVTRVIIQVETPTTQASPTKPSATLTFTPTRTSSPSITPTPQRFWVTVDEELAHIRDGPGIVYSIVNNKMRGTLLEAVGRNIASDWFVVLLDNGRPAWISTRVIVYSFDSNLLPIVAAPPTPVIPTRRPTDSTGSGANPPSNSPTWTPPPP